MLTEKFLNRSLTATIASVSGGRNCQNVNFEHYCYLIAESRDMMEQSRFSNQSRSIVQQSRSNSYHI